jgi:predicted dehydrogenase
LLLTCGRPQAVHSRGRLRGDVVEFVETQYVYEDSALSVTSTSGVLRQQGREFTHAFEIRLEKATLLFDFALFAGGETHLLPLTRLGARGRVERPRLPGTGDPEEAFAAEIADVVAAVSGRRAAPALSATLARDALELCLKEGQSVKRGTLVKV